MSSSLNAIAHKRPLPGRAVILTFDDGYLDFFTYAYPILKEYGFSATVFLVSEQVGKSNQWDTVYGERVPLMDWSQVRRRALNLALTRLLIDRSRLYRWQK